ncbi:hypothetical protein [Flavobacterium dankookense]|uniref:Uncharacterized protein n=1 Tax=Flavobacterium dankookense TaxID=706186 RepID=A0A4R6QIH4_9FLAO|nr:hypothetical protein [Flavobacterium dankookense]TDP61942.1 hypothetical protein BC748_0054 [Flavobacterium dankookense]
MKKLFFSAVALVAFSSVSMAETKESGTGKECTKVFLAALDTATSNGASEADAWMFASVAQYFCLKEVRLF